MEVEVLQVGTFNGNNTEQELIINADTKTNTFESHPFSVLSGPETQAFLTYI
jgi:hypothetical protein